MQSGFQAAVGSPAFRLCRASCQDDDTLPWRNSQSVTGYRESMDLALSSLQNGVRSLHWMVVRCGGGGGRFTAGKDASGMRTYRMVSWWLRKDALPWPNKGLQDQFRRRADRLAAAGADSAIIFGAHFRWDFCRVWEPLHELIRFVADELHARDMILFDHHSSVHLLLQPRPGAFRAHLQQSPPGVDFASGRRPPAGGRA